MSNESHPGLDWPEHDSLNGASRFRESEEMGGIAVGIARYANIEKPRSGLTGRGWGLGCWVMEFGLLGQSSAIPLD